MRRVRFFEDFPPGKGRKPRLLIGILDAESYADGGRREAVRVALKSDTERWIVQYNQYYRSFVEAAPAAPNR